MDHERDHQRLSPRQLAHLVGSGRLSEADVARLQEGDPAAQSVLADIRVRHAAERLDRVVAAGVVSEEEATRLLVRVRAGNDSRELRRELNRLTRLANTEGGLESQRR